MNEQHSAGSSNPMCESDRWIASLITHLEDNWRAIDQGPIERARAYLMGHIGCEHGKPLSEFCERCRAYLQSPKGKDDLVAFGIAHGWMPKAHADVKSENDLLHWRAQRALDLLEDAPGAAREALAGGYDHEFANAPETVGCPHCAEAYRIWETNATVDSVRVMNQMRDAVSVGMFRRAAQETLPVGMPTDGLIFIPCELHKQTTFTGTVGYTALPKAVCPSCMNERQAAEIAEAVANTQKAAASPADLVGALQDVVHTDTGPVRAARSVRSSEPSSLDPRGSLRDSLVASNDLLNAMETWRDSSNANLDAGSAMLEALLELMIVTVNNKLRIVGFTEDRIMRGVTSETSHQEHAVDGAGDRGANSDHDVPGQLRAPDDLTRRPIGQCSWGCYYGEDGKLVRDSACTVHGASSENGNPQA